MNSDKDRLTPETEANHSERSIQEGAHILARQRYPPALELIAGCNFCMKDIWAGELWAGEHGRAAIIQRCFLRNPQYFLPHDPIYFVTHDILDNLTTLRLTHSQLA